MPRLPTKQPDSFHCWGCQQTKQAAEQIRLDDASPIPVCSSCWGLLPVSERLKHAQAFRDRAKGGILAEAAALIASSFGHFIETRRFGERGDN